MSAGLSGLCSGGSAALQPHSTSQPPGYHHHQGVQPCPVAGAGVGVHQHLRLLGNSSSSRLQRLRLQHPRSITALPSSGFHQQLQQQQQQPWRSQQQTMQPLAAAATRHVNHLQQQQQPLLPHQLMPSSVLRQQCPVPAAASSPIAVPWGGRRSPLSTTCRAAAASHAFSDDSSSSNNNNSSSSSSASSDAASSGVFTAAATFTSGLADTAQDLQELLQRFLGLWRKFLPMLSLFFCLSFINTMLDSLKDTLVITAAGGGAFVIPYLTVYAVLPLSMVFLVAYTAASHRVPRSVLFNCIVAGFVAFFGFFALFLYPNADVLHPHALADQLQKVVPRGLAGAVGMFRNWTFTLFFCMSELWGDVCMGLLFWGLANEITNLSDAATLYPLFGLGANLAQFIAGLVLKATTRGGATEFAAALQASMAAVVVIACIAIVLQQYITNKAEAEAAALRHRHLHRHNSTHPSAVASRTASPTPQQQQQQQQEQEAAAAAAAAAAKQKKKNKQQPSLAATFRVLSASVEIRCLACMSLAQGLCNSLMEFAWKCHMRLLYPSPADFTAFLGDVATWSGVVTGGLMLMSPLLFERLGWRGVANTTPTILLYGGSAFFVGCIAYQHMFGHTVAAAGAAAAGPAAVALLQGLVIFGALLYVFGRGAKFSLFKPAEEMVYITLDEDGRTRGKAAIDVVGAQTGKSGGSLLQQALLITSAGSIVGIMPVLFAVFFVMLRGWSSAVTTLSSVRHYSYDSPISSLDEEEEEEGVGVGAAAGVGGGKGGVGATAAAAAGAGAAAVASGSGSSSSGSSLGASEQQELLLKLQGLAATAGAEAGGVDDGTSTTAAAAAATHGSGSKAFQAAMARSSQSNSGSSTNGSVQAADAPSRSSSSLNGGSSSSSSSSNGAATASDAQQQQEYITLSHDAAHAFRRSRREGASGSGSGSGAGEAGGAGSSGGGVSSQQQQQATSNGSSSLSGSSGSLTTTPSSGSSSSTDSGSSGALADSDAGSVDSTSSSSSSRVSQGSAEGGNA